MPLDRAMPLGRETSKLISFQVSGAWLPHDITYAQVSLEPSRRERHTFSIAMKTDVRENEKFEEWTLTITENKVLFFQSLLKLNCK